MQTISSAPPSSGLAANAVLLPLVWTRAARRPSTRRPEVPKRWSRYERLSFSMLGYTWGILIVAVAALHIGNYQLETITSSTSGSHSAFHDGAQAIKPDQQSPQPLPHEGAKP
ncbi:hypothetical protein CCOS865_03886 [Pseudomonas reidholzensis]|uniref:Uncharacterized protein n=1 Tax=Pseudomonas reidholzensis TaxID=1785162 RepID=A0A383RZ03_9PSED|nr:hypothetical protein [Pseudomonas reidholzensis]SYX91608.1 hypothetical protein CCOS865_03886 [Pseudomonas reidholzensis]